MSVHDEAGEKVKGGMQGREWGDLWKKALLDSSHKRLLVCVCVWWGCGHVPDEVSIWFCRGAGVPGVSPHTQSDELSRVGRGRCGKDGAPNTLFIFPSCWSLTTWTQPLPPGEVPLRAAWCRTDSFISSSRSLSAPSRS